MRGHGPAIRLEPVYLLWVGFALIYLVSFWWWEFKFSQLEVEWTFALYLFLLAYALGLFLMAVVLVPADMEGVVDSYAYFMSGRRWFLGVVLLCVVLDFIDTSWKGPGRLLEPEYLIQTGVCVLACLVAMVSKRWGMQLTAAIVAFCYQLVFIFQTLGTLGRW